MLILSILLEIKGNRKEAERRRESVFCSVEIFMRFLRNEVTTGPKSKDPG